MTPPASTTDKVTVAQIADLLAWARRLTQAGRTADPADRAAYQATKAALLARIAAQHTTTPRMIND